MIEMYKVSSSQFNYLYGDQIHFPYSIGRLVTYVKTNKNINSQFKFDRTFIFRDQLNNYVEQSYDSDILLCSCYVWNWEVTKQLAKKVKATNPNCLIIFGGPQVPNRTENFFEENPFVDIIVHGEGEIVLENILTAYIKDKDFSKINGIEMKDYRTPPNPRIKDVNILPSPYLTNLILDLVEQKTDIKYIAAWETNRGCPYPCTFCDWGSLTNSKVTNWSEEQLLKEIDWFAQNHITYIDCCDANFGIFQERDYRIASKLKEVALKTGYPEKFRAAWAKFASEKIIPIAKQLQEGKVLKAVSLALQSLDEETLEIVKRANIKFDNFSELTETFRKNKIPTYTELIMGLPGETLESWKKGLEILASGSQVGSIYIYNCGVFVNAPMNEPTYMKFHNIKTIRSPIFLAHSSIHDRGIPEFEYITISSKSFSTDDLKEIYLFSWLFQTFHSLGIFEYITKYYHDEKKLLYVKFYEIFLDYCKKENSIFSDEYNKVIDYIDNGYSGKGWNHYDPNLGDIFWPIEEATWLRLVLSKKLMEHTKSFLKFLEETLNFDTPDEILNDLIKFQIFLITTRQDSEIKSARFHFNWKNYFINGSKLKQIENDYNYKNLVIEHDQILWGYKTIWYGRQSKSYKLHPEALEEGKIITVEN
tara:strand:+ start:1594 stop:3534 length:1941 start_codon:yes stop_codon:yes gene_type:complete